MNKTKNSENFDDGLTRVAPKGEFKANKTENSKDELESYIARVGANYNVCIRKHFRKYGYVKISLLSEKEFNVHLNNLDSAIKEEESILKQQRKLQEHLKKLREIRNGRKGIL